VSIQRERPQEEGLVLFAGPVDHLVDVAVPGLERLLAEDEVPEVPEKGVERRVPEVSLEDVLIPGVVEHEVLEAVETPVEPVET